MFLKRGVDKSVSGTVTFLSQKRSLFTILYAVISSSCKENTFVRRVEPLCHRCHEDGGVSYGLAYFHGPRN